MTGVKTLRKQYCHSVMSQLPFGRVRSLTELLREIRACSNKQRCHVMTQAAGGGPGCLEDPMSALRSLSLFFSESLGRGGGDRVVEIDNRGVWAGKPRELCPSASVNNLVVHPFTNTWTSVGVLSGDRWGIFPSDKANSAKEWKNHRIQKTPGMCKLEVLSAGTTGIRALLVDWCSAALQEPAGLTHGG